jgi:hypothetical protein
MAKKAKKKKTVKKKKTIKDDKLAVDGSFLDVIKAAVAPNKK